MHLLRLLGRSDLPGADRPHRFIRYHNLIPVRDLVGHSCHLPLADFKGLAGLSFLEKLTDTQDNSKTLIESVFCLSSNDFVGFLDLRQMPPLRMPKDHPITPNVRKHLGTDLPSESAATLHPAVLASHSKVLAEILACIVQVRERRTADHLHITHWRPLVETSYELRNRVPIPVTFPVASDEEFPRGDAGRARAGGGSGQAPSHRAHSGEVRRDAWLRYVVGER
mmetsp:Transcript_22697/g.40145  ORF Transcript_22697/g.40145 Transcript_22697/m.40145 type:complete len:224 (-) Transcript_22697:228-899(-)